MIVDDLIEKGKINLYKDNQEEVKKERFKAILETTRRQIEKCGLYRQLCKQKNFDPHRDLKSIDDIKNIPYLTSANFKQKKGRPKEFLCVPESEIRVWMASSGTSGDPSIVGRDRINIQRTFNAYDFMNKEILNLSHYDWSLFFFPQPRRRLTREDKLSEPIPSMAYVFNVQNKLPLGEKRVYALKLADEETRKKGKIFEFDAETTVGFLNTNHSEKEIGWISGSIPLLYMFLLEFYKKTGQTFNCGEKSVLMSGGGWKSYSGESVSPEKFRDALSKILGIPRKSIRDIYAFTETDCLHPECEYYNKHLLPWQDIIIRDVETLEPLEMGESGLINVINPLAYSYAGVSILQDDIGRIILEDTCPCGRKGKAIEILGRAEGAEGKGCGAQLTEETSTK
ncbi:MAG: hypothetical protein ACFE9T_14905 [Promethearchaeota archaeon]